MNDKKQKRRGVYLKSSSQKEGLEEYDPVKGKGLKLQWLNFIAAYIKNGGNATEAYMSAYPEAGKETARRNGSRLLTHADILREISNRYDQQATTEAWVIATARKYVLAGIKNPKYAYAGVKALEMIAKSRGMLTDTHKVEFTAENPCIFPSLVKPENFKKFEEEEKLGIRITE